MDITTLYWVLALGFGGMSFVSFALGEVFGFAEHIFGGIGDLFGGLVGGDHNFDAGGHDSETGGDPSPFSIRSIFAFFAGFGAGGIMGKGLGMSDPVSIAPAGMVGITMALGMWLALRFFYSQQGSSSIQPVNFLNLVCRVNISIPEGKGQMGQVAVVVRGERQNIPAVSDDGSGIAYQSAVYIKSMDGGVATVAKT